MRCSKARRWISSGLDGAMDEARSAALGQHLAACTECQRFEAELRECVALLGRIPIPDPPSEFTKDVTSRLGQQERRVLDRREFIRPIPIGLAAASFLFGTMLSIWVENGPSSSALGTSNNQTLSESDLVGLGVGDDLTQLVANLLPEMGE